MAKVSPGRACGDDAILLAVENSFQDWAAIGERWQRTEVGKNGLKGKALACKSR